MAGWLMVKLASELMVAGSSFEQVESYYKIRLPDDLQPWHDVLSKSGLLGKDSYIRLLPPAEVFEAKKGVMPPDLVPIFQDIYGNALGWRESPLDAAGGGWYWYDYDESCLGSLGPAFRGMLRALAFALACEAWEGYGRSSGTTHSPEETLAEAKAVLRLPGLFDQPEQMLRSIGEMESRRGPPTDNFLSFWMSLLSDGVAVPIFAEAAALRDWRTGRTLAAAAIWQKTLAVDCTSCLIHWHLGMAALVNGDSGEATRHFATAFEGSWENRYNRFLAFPGYEVTDLAAVARFLRGDSGKYVATSRFPELRELLLSGGLDDVGAWRETLARCLRSGNLDGAKIIAINGTLSPIRPDCLDKDPGYFRYCLDVLTEVYQKRGLGTRVEHLADA